MWRWLHRWTGLAAGVWLAVVGGTGVLLDHKDWRWMRQSILPDSWASESLIQTARGLLIRQYQIDPADPGHRIASGWRGVWVTFDGGAHWTAARFGASGHDPVPLVFALETARDWRTVLLGTDDGVMRSDDGGVTYRLAGLAGHTVNGLARTSQTDHWLAVLDRSVLVDWQPAEAGATVGLSPPPTNLLSATEGLGRFFSNLHLGSGLLPGTRSTLIWNDLAGIGMVVLPVTGLLYWLGLWRGGLGRAHGWWIGAPLVVPLVYLTVTGVYLGHRGSLAPILSGVQISRDLLPAAYRFGDGWDGEIAAAIPLPPDDARVAIATRHGLFLYDRSSSAWSLMSRGAFWGARRLNDELVAFGVRDMRCGIAPAVCVAATEPGPHMVSDAAVFPGGTLVWVGHDVGQGDATPLPMLPGVPLQFVINQIHRATIPFAAASPLVTDAAAVALLVSVVSGIARLVSRSGLVNRRSPRA